MRKYMVNLIKCLICRFIEHIIEGEGGGEGKGGSEGEGESEG